jgi:hypothetical protein
VGGQSHEARGVQVQMSSDAARGSDPTPHDLPVDRGHLRPQGLHPGLDVAVGVIVPSVAPVSPFWTGGWAQERPR